MSTSTVCPNPPAYDHFHCPEHGCVEYLCCGPTPALEPCVIDWHNRAIDRAWDAHFVCLERVRIFRRFQHAARPGYVAHWLKRAAVHRQTIAGHLAALRGDPNGLHPYRFES